MQSNRKLIKASKKQINKQKKMKNLSLNKANY